MELTIRLFQMDIIEGGSVCTVDGCTAIFLSRRERLKHLQQVHSLYLMKFKVPKRCPVLHCTLNSNFTYVKSLEEHLFQHGISETEMEDAMATSRMPDKLKPAKPCPVCRKSFDRRSHLKRHLEGVHNWEPTKCQEFLNSLVAQETLGNERPIAAMQPSVDLIPVNLPPVDLPSADIPRVEYSKRDRSQYWCSPCKESRRVVALSSHMRVVHGLSQPQSLKVLECLRRSDVPEVRVLSISILHKCF